MSTSTSLDVGPGALVRYRERDWVVLPSADPDLLLLRPIGGSARETTGVVRSLADLIGYTLPYERVEAATFPLPAADSAQDGAAVQLLQQAARLLLRDGAAPFRSLGNLSLRPRPYQYAPLIMALRLDTVRLLIADDVGVGKTIEAGLVARELLDRGLIRRLAVLCPPYLCDQWQQELAEKFNVQAVVARSGTIAQLERAAPHDTSIFAHFPHIVASIDTVKSERYRAAFLQHCPELLIVDEVHGAAAPPGERRAVSQQQRHDLVARLAADESRHLLLLSATPHSGVESSFLSILGLLRPEFARLDMARLAAEERIDLARHFIQRRRADVRRWMGEDTPFPERDTTGAEQPYTFTGDYRDFYNGVYAFARELVQSAEALSGARRRMRFWSALALLRCVSSSPAAARAALQRRLERQTVLGDGGLLDQSTAEDLDATFAPLIYDPAEVEAAVDAPPATVFDAQAEDPAWGDAESRRLREFARAAAKLAGAPDAKLSVLIDVVGDMLAAGYRPIVWCRYIATTEYVAAALRAAFERRQPDLRVAAVTGALADDERRLKVEELAASPRRVLVATDCLSEGINLQEHFNAVIHYDLPWNPNRLEQREGRVDRFGQLSPTVRAVLIFGADNPVDGAVLDVLLRKARAIYNKLGVNTPLPMDSETILNAVLHSLFNRPGPSETARQLRLFDVGDESGRLVQRVHEQWTAAAEREKESRTRFAQRGIQPDEVAEALRETDRVLGGPDEVRRFVHEAAGRLGIAFQERRGAGPGPAVYHIVPATLPAAARLRLGALPDPWPVTFVSPPPEGVTYVGRAHPLVEALAEHLVDLAFHPIAERVPPAARTGVIRTAAVERRTTLCLLHLRYLQHEPGADAPTLAEETVVWGYTGYPPDVQPIAPAAAAALLDEARPAANVGAAEKREALAEALAGWDALQPALAVLLDDRAADLAAGHRRVRRLLERERLRLEPRTPPDLLGIVVLLPVPKGMRE
jgi:superfamily II DNA or RNA helicase